MSYKHTLNIPKTDFSMKAELVANSKKFKDFWVDLQLWNKLSSRKESPKFTLHDGPPYANGDIHLGHALNKVLKDFILRYKALKGFCLDYTPGWDTHGLPIENKIEREKEYKSSNPLQKRESCRKYALKQTENQKSQFLQLHLLHDFQKHYKTLDSEFVNLELNAFVFLLEQGLIYWDLKPVAWSWSSHTALAELEIIHKEVECRSIYFWFPVEEDFCLNNHTLKRGTRLLIWTTTPYTLEANLAIAINAEFTYSLIRTPEGIEYLLLKDVAEKLGIKGEEIFTCLGEEIKNASYFNPITEQSGRVINANFVTRDTGTGIVHIAPGFGLEDYQACMKERIEVYVSIDKNGNFISKTKFEPINGLFYQDAIEVVISWMKERGYIHKEEVITHSVGHDWRTEKPLIYLASPQWFINIKKLKPQIKKAFSNKINSSPQWLVQRLEELILKREEWCLSRQRVWGTPIPILFDENGDPILEIDQIKRNVEILSKEGLDVWFKEDANYFLHPSLKPKYEEKKLKKSKDILDVWFDSGCSWGILDPNTTADVYLEGFDQLRGWFNSSASISIAMKDKLPFKSLISHGFVLDKNGNKMSKSKGNVIDPMELVNKYGADVLRLWIGFNNYLEDIKISEESIENAISLYRKIRNTVFRYSLSVLPKNFEIDWGVIKNLSQEENIYIYQTFRECCLQMDEALENHLFFKAIKHSLSFLNTYSSWYLEICKDCLYCDPIDSPTRKEVINIVGVVFEKLLFFFSIFLPQTAEDAWSHYKGETESSIFLNKWVELKGDDYKVDNDVWNNFWKLRDEVYLLIENLKNKGVVSGPSSVKLTLPKNRFIKGLNLLKLLNVGELEEGENLEVYKSLEGVCQRCRRHNPKLSEEKLCSRCESIIKT